MTLSVARQSTIDTRALLAQNTTARDHVRGRCRVRGRTTATLAGAASVVVSFALSGCYRYPWRAAPDPIAAAAASVDTPLLVTTRAPPNGAAHRYVLSWARVAEDSLVGVVFEEYRRIEGGRWSMV